MTEQTLVFKNNLPNLTVLKLFSQDFSIIKAKLQQKIKQAPMMFIGMQIIIDVSNFDKESELVLDVDALLAFLQGEGVNPVAIMTDRLTFREILVKNGVGVLPVLQNKTEPPASTVVTKHHANETPEVGETSLDEEAVADNAKQEEPRKTFEDDSAATHINIDNQIIRHPIRSGQRIYSKGDLTVVGSVSHGAEVIANGSIHVYGKLRGRAIAGATGDEEASIFCQDLDAELVSIAGNYKQLEDIEDGYRNKRVQISLEKEKIVFSSL